jgi:hypothetical protein
MTFSRQFRALLKLAGLWALPWTALGLGVAIIRWLTNPDITSTAPSLGNWLLSHALGYGALGAISGLYLGLMLARIERGRQAEEVPLRRIALYSGLAGAIPPVLFAGLGLVFGAPPGVFLPLLGLGAFSAVISGGLATTTLAAVQRRMLSKPEDHPKLGAT